ncbi:MAG: squalene--hopene cyclase [Planctomycetaceae bacterium]
MNAPSSLWNDPRLATLIAAVAVALLIATVWLMRRKSRDGRGAAAICLVLSISLHGLLIYFLPALRKWGGGAGNPSSQQADTGLHQVTIADFSPSEVLTDTSGAAAPTPETQPLIAPLPLALPQEAAVAETTPQSQDPISDPVPVPDEAAATDPLLATESLPSALASLPEPEADADEAPSAVDDLLSQWLSADAEKPAVAPANPAPAVDPPTGVQPPSPPASEASASRPANLPGWQQNDFVQRAGDAKRLALLATGGDESTEAAVEAGLRFLAADQGADGAWDPATSGAGRETMTLGTDRGGAGKRATNGITGLALLSMLGAGNTHLSGPYADNVRRGLSYLIRSQHPDGSLAGPATVYEANYCHGMAALAMCEAAAMTGDESAMRSAAAAVRYTISVQHPTTGGWRYVRGDPGDLSQLGWQAMVLDAGHRASIPVSPQSFAGTARFLRSVRSGPNGGLASYRPGDGPTRTMTAEALATRLLLGETIPAVEIAEAEAYLLRQPPGVGKDNYYGWYYTALALHQLQDDAWRQWNAAMKEHLIARQSSSGSWPTDDEWGGYGGRIYTTATATLCLEVYYRHAIRQNHLAEQPQMPETIQR